MSVFSSFTAFFNFFYKFLFLSAFDSHSIRFFQTLSFAYPFFPIVSNASIFRGIFNFYFVIGAHKSVLGFENHIANAYFSRVEYIHNLFYSYGRKVLFSTTRIAKDHCEITGFYAFERYWEEMFGAIGYIVFGVLGRTVVFIGIDAEEREVTCMARPHPVISVRTKFTNRGRGSAY